MLYGDVVVDQPLAPMVADHRRARAAATVAVYESRLVDGKGTVAVDGDGWITRFVEKDPSVRPPALINAGLYVLEPGLLADLPRGEELDFGYDVFPARSRAASGSSPIGWAIRCSTSGRPRAWPSLRLRAGS